MMTYNDEALMPDQIESVSVNNQGVGQQERVSLSHKWGNKRTLKATVPLDMLKTKEESLTSNTLEIVYKHGKSGFFVINIFSVKLERE